MCVWRNYISVTLIPLHEDNLIALWKCENVKIWKFCENLKFCENFFRLKNRLSIVEQQNGLCWLKVTNSLAFVWRKQSLLCISQYSRDNLHLITGKIITFLGIRWPFIQFINVINTLKYFNVPCLPFIYYTNSLTNISYLLIHDNCDWVIILTAVFLQCKFA